MPLHTLTGERVYLDADGKATEDEAKGVSLLGIKGDDIPMEAAYAAGLVKNEPKQEQASEPKMVSYDQDGKRVAADSPNARFQYLDNDPTRPDAPPAGEPAAAGDSYDDMKKDDLRALAEERGVEVASDARVADIREALRAADQKE